MTFFIQLMSRTKTKYTMKRDSVASKGNILKSFQYQTKIKKKSAANPTAQNPDPTLKYHGVISLHLLDNSTGSTAADIPCRTLAVAHAEPAPRQLHAALSPVASTDSKTPIRIRNRLVNRRPASFAIGKFSFFIVLLCVIL
jgi:hypothetical protein